MLNSRLKSQIDRIFKKGRFTSKTVEFEDEGLEGGVYVRSGNWVVWPQYNPESVVLYNVKTKKKEILRSKAYHTKFDRISNREILG